MNKRNSLIFITIVSIPICIFISGCNFNKKGDKRPTIMQVTQFSHLQLREDLLYYNNTDTVPYTGKVIENWDSSSVRLEFFCKNGIRDSTEIQWFPNGKLKSKSKYKQGLPVDTIIKWYDTGQKMVVAFYEQGVINGKLIVWYLNGNKFCETNYLDGEKNGFETHWLKNGDTTTVIEYKNDELNGVQIVFNKNGIPKNTTYNTPMPPAIKRKHFIEIAENTEFKNREVLLDSINVEGGLIYVKGEKSPYYGKVVCLYPDKKVKFIENEINGVTQGDLTGWYDTGALKYKMKYLWGRSYGLSPSWYENGKIKLDGVSSIGSFTGIVRSYNNDGTISSQYDLIRGVLYGTEINYYKNGMKKSVIEYINDEVMSETTWDEKGTLIKTVTNKQ